MGAFSLIVVINLLNRSIHDSAIAVPDEIGMSRTRDFKLRACPLSSL